MIERVWLSYNATSKRIMYGVTGVSRIDAWVTVWKKPLSGEADQEICTFRMVIVPGTVYSYYEVEIEFELTTYYARISTGEDGQNRKCQLFFTGRPIVA